MTMSQLINRTSMMIDSSISEMIIDKGNHFNLYDVMKLFTINVLEIYKSKKHTFTSHSFVKLNGLTFEVRGAYTSINGNFVIELYNYKTNYNAHIYITDLDIEEFK